MPPLLRPLKQVSGPLPPSSLPISSFLLPFLHTQRRCASILSSLSDNPGAYHKKIRVGRGPASGKGKTSGRGHKGQKQHGKVPRGFNGGQSKTEVVRGFPNVFAEDLIPLNLDRLQTWINQGRIDPTRPITVKELADSRCATNIKDGIKLLARGATQIQHPLHIIVSRASASAIAAIEAAGGQITTRYYTRLAIQRILQGRTDPANSLLTRDRVPVMMIGGENLSDNTGAAGAAGAAGGAGGAAGGAGGGFMNRLPDPTSRKDIEYYRDPAHRGYLSYQVQEGEGPSLFHKPPKRIKAQAGAKDGEVVKKKSASENRLW